MPERPYRPVSPRWWRIVTFPMTLCQKLRVSRGVWRVAWHFAVLTLGKGHPKDAQAQDCDWITSL